MPAEPPHRSLSVLVLAAVIVAAGTWAYWPSFNGVFVLDDVRAIVQNPTIRTLWPLTTPLSPPSASTVAGRPVANLSFAISYALGPADVSGAASGTPGMPGVPGTLDATAFHLGNLLIHLATALVLAGVVRRTLLSPPLRRRFEVVAPWLALTIALIWVVHPLQTAAVTYLVQRVESLMGLFYLLTLYCAIRASGTSHVRVWTAAAVVSCAAGMATKEVMVTAPIMVALWDRLFGAAVPNGTSRTRWGLLAGLAATWLVLGILVLSEHRGPSISLAPGIVWTYLLTQADVVVHYLRLVFIPAPLVFLYDWPLAPSLLAVAWQAALLTALVVLTAIGVVRRHPAGFLGAWFFLILAPSSSVLPIVTEVAAEHRMYLPLAAIVAAVVMGLFRAGGRVSKNSRTGAVLAVVAVVGAVGALGVATRARNRVYGSAEGLWQDTVSNRPDDARPRIAYGEALASAGRLAEAEAQLQVGVALAPQDPLARVRLAAVLAQRQKLDAAIPHLEQALTLRPGDVDAHRYLGEIFAIQRHDRLALSHYEQALAAVPNDVEVLAKMATILADSRDLSVRDAERAVALASRAVGLTSGREPRLLEILSAAQAASGRFSAAAATARTALELARARGDGALASALEYRVSAYEYRASQASGPRR